MAYKLHTSPRQIPNLISPPYSPTFSNHHKPPLHFSPPPSLLLNNNTTTLPSLTSSTTHHRTRFLTARVIRGQQLTDTDDDGPQTSTSTEEEEEDKDEEIMREGEKKEPTKQSIWNQMKEIVVFTGPATGLWICGPLMSLIDTAVIGQGSSIELAALGPATVVCDYMSYVFMFLSVATSNMVATALAKQDREEVQHHISVLLFVGLACGFVMLLFTRLFGAATLTAFTGPKNVDIVAAANTYVQIRGLAWPALLVGWVAQSASLGMKDSWGPLKALAAASVINGIGDILLCTYFGYGIAGAAWATMASQVVAAFMMIQTLNKKGYNAFAFSIPSGKELLMILGLAAPVFLTMMSKVAFYSLLIYFATSMGTHTMAAHQVSFTCVSHFMVIPSLACYLRICRKSNSGPVRTQLSFQVMVQTFCMCTVWGEPLSQTAQSFMPELIYGVNRNLSKARLLLRSLVIIGAILGFLLGIVGTCVPWLFPYIFTPDQMVIREMHRVLIPYFVALVVTPPTHSLEGTLLAGRDLKFVSLSMSGCLCLGALVLWILSSRYGLQGCWFALAGFQWARFSMALQRLLSPNGILYSEDLHQQKLRTA